MTYTAQIKRARVALLRSLRDRSLARPISGGIADAQPPANLYDPCRGRFYWLIRIRTVVSVVAAALVTLPICLLPVAVAVTMLLVSSQYKIVPTV